MTSPYYPPQPPSAATTLPKPAPYPYDPHALPSSFRSSGAYDRHYLPSVNQSPDPSLDGYQSINSIPRTEAYGIPQLSSDGNEYARDGAYNGQAGPSVTSPRQSQYHYQYHQPQVAHPELIQPEPQANSHQRIHPPPTQLSPTIEPLPPPQPKVAYDPPVFQTFQQKKRAKELAMMAQSGVMPVRSDSWNSFSSSSSRNLPTTPSASTLTMIGQGNRSAPPAPPPRSPSLPPSFLPLNHRPSIPNIAGSPSLPISPSAQAFIPPSLPNSSRPLPQPAAIKTNLTPFNSALPSPRSPLASSPSPTQATLERSDTLSSVKSLDRMGFSSSSGRPLPQPPVAVNSSKSLDRGIVPTSEPFKRGFNRKQPSTVSEEGSDDGLSSGISKMTIDGASAVSSPVAVPEPALPRPPVLASDRTDHRTPAKFTPLPSINLPDESSESSAQSTDNEDANQYTSGQKLRDIQISPPKRAPSPSIVITGLPTISVSSSDSTELPELSFTVPTFSFDSEPSPSSATLPLTINLSSALASSSAPPPTVHHIQPNGAIICAGCRLPIIGRIVSAMKERWHPGCFSCAECGELLEHVSSYEWEGKAYCHLDYHDKFAYRCHHCKTPIVDSRFVTLDDPMLGQRYYHELHFFCSECGDPFLDPSKSSAPGTERSRNARTDGEDPEEEIETNDFVIHKGHPYCEKCHLRLHKPKCKACSKPIPDMAISAMGAKWHKDCFNCSDCGNVFANNLFFPKEGNALCTTCYEDLISN